MKKYKRSTPTLSKKVLAVDPGFDRVGISILTSNKSGVGLLFSQCFKTSTKQSHSERLLAIGQEIHMLIKKWRPESLAVETLFFNKNTTSALGVAEARGIILYEAEKGGLKIFEYSPQAIKIAVTSYGRADKAQVLSMVKKLLNLPDKTDKRLDDEIDAIALGITHLATERGI